MRATLEQVACDGAISGRGDRSVIGSYEVGDRMAQEVSSHPSSFSAPSQRPSEQGGSESPERHPAPPPRPEPARDGAPIGSVRLDRLLEVAVLTPAQASLVAAGLLTSASKIGQGRRSDVRISPPLITPSGDVHAVPARDPSTAVAVDDVLTHLVATAQRLPAHPRLHQVALLRRLDEVRASSHEPAARALMLHEAMDDALGPDAHTRVRRELVALVAAFAELSDAEIEAPIPTRPRPAPRVTGPGPRRRLGRRRRRRGRRIAIAVPVCLLVLAGGYVALGRPHLGISSDPAPSTPHSAAKTPPKSHHHDATHQQSAVPVLAQRTSGRITGVSLQRLGVCQPGGLCPVQVTVNLAPAAVTEAVGWRVGVVQACTRQVTWSLPKDVTAQPGWTHVYASSSVQIPADHPFALVAVTNSPDRAQSPPVRLATSAPHC